MILLGLDQPIIQIKLSCYMYIVSAPATVVRLIADLQLLPVLIVRQAVVSTLQLHHTAGDRDPRTCT